MIIKPLIRSNMCINAHPIGCAKEVENQIAYVEKKAAERGKLPSAPKNVLVLGCSTGYGLASRIAAAFECPKEAVPFSSHDATAKAKSQFSEALKSTQISKRVFFADDTRKRIKAKIAVG